MKRCNPKGRSCIEKNSIRNFNCSVGCKGIYADVSWESGPLEEKDGTDPVHWEKEEIERALQGEVDIRQMKTILKGLFLGYSQLEKKMDMMKNGIGKKNKYDDDIETETIKKLIFEYRKFKRRNVRHFRFNENASSSVFGKQIIYPKMIQILLMYF